MNNKGNMTKGKKVEKVIYEACRLEAKWSKRSVIPEKWENRDDSFKQQFYKTIEKYLTQKRLPTPKQAHNSWVKAYKKMGWKYGKTRNQKKKLHPDILPFEQLTKDERDKDAIFLMALWIVRNT